MSPAALIFILLMLGGVAFFVTQPLIRRNPEAVGQEFYEENLMETLLHKKDAVYAAIKETEFDYKTNKLSDDDYSELRQKLENEAVDLLGQIDSAAKDEKAATRKVAAKEKAPAKTKSGITYCVDCGAAIAKSDSKFCPSCGEALS